MKLQTTCASDKAAHIKVSVKEKVSREMSISAQREESQDLEREKMREKCSQEKKGKQNLSKKDHTYKHQRLRGTKRTDE